MIRASTRENLSSGFANNKGADQPAHLGRLVSAFAILTLSDPLSPQRQVFTWLLWHLNVQLSSGTRCLHFRMNLQKITILCMPLVKSAYQIINFLISQPKEPSQ